MAPAGEHFILAVMVKGETICLYCGSSIRKGAVGEESRTVEHIIGYCLGGALTIPAHRRCNGKANQIVDSKLEALPPIGRIRGELGIRSRSGRYIHREAWNSPQGPRAFMYWSQDGRLPKLIPAEVPIDEKSTEVFLENDSELSNDFEEKRRERVEREGCYLAEPREPTDRPSMVGKEVAILFREPRWFLPKYLWCAAAAKFSLGVLADGLHKGLLHSSILDLPLLEGLRAMAFEKSLMTDLWDPSRFRYEPSRLDATSILAQLHQHEHLLALRKGQAAQSPVLQAVIFGESTYELSLPGLPIERDRVWLFDSLRRSLIRLEWADLEERISNRGTEGAAQLELEISSDAVSDAEQLVTGLKS
jgi:hypothetical protein